MPDRKKVSENGRNRRSQNKASERRPHHNAGSLTRLSIRGFRGIRELLIDGMAPLTILTGDNGAGKSTVLEAAFAVYGRTNPAWVHSLQGRRGLAVFSKEGPSYLGLFYGSPETGSAEISGVTTKRTKLRLEIECAETGPQRVVLERGAGHVGDLAKHPPNLKFHAFRDGELENRSELVWTFTPPNTGELQPRGGKPSDPPAMFQHPSSGLLGDEEMIVRYGDVRETGADRVVKDLVRSVDPRVDDIEHLQTSRARYFRATLADGTRLPLGMLGGGVVNVFQSGVNLATVRDGFLAIDEIENGLHHSRLPDIFRALLNAQRLCGAQLMVATHSDEALKAMVGAATRHDALGFAVINLRRDSNDQVHATVIPGPDAASSLDHGYELR